MQERQKAIELLQAAIASGARQKTACEILGLSARTLQRWCQPEGLEDRRGRLKPVQSHQLSEQERQQVLDIANSVPYGHLPPCQIVPQLADQGTYIASESTFYRILRQEKLLKHRQKAKIKSHHKPRELVASSSNQVWSWDVTYLPTAVRGAFYYLYLVMDVFSRKIVGWTVQPMESSEHAAWLMQDICKSENIFPHQVTLHSDNGAIMKGSTLLSTLQKLGIVASFSRPAVSNDNPYSEALFRTIKYSYFYPDKPFSSLESARSWVEAFVEWYNTKHCHSALKFITPNERHQGKTAEIMGHRSEVYEMAKQRNPNRWSRHIRNWVLPDKIILNPTRQTKDKLLKADNESEIVVAMP